MWDIKSLKADKTTDSLKCNGEANPFPSEKDATPENLDWGNTGIKDVLFSIREKMFKDVTQYIYEQRVAKNTKTEPLITILEQKPEFYSGLHPVVVGAFDITSYESILESVSYTRNACIEAFDKFGMDSYNAVYISFIYTSTIISSNKCVNTLSVTLTLYKQEKVDIIDETIKRLDEMKTSQEDEDVEKFLRDQASVFRSRFPL